jgi:hypothetical protein
VNLEAQCERFGVSDQRRGVPGRIPWKVDLLADRLANDPDLRVEAPASLESITALVSGSRSGNTAQEW